MTASIRVRKGCTCKLRWFACQCDVEEDVFTAPAGSEWTIEDTTIPSRAFVDYVANLHPDADLVYVRLPGINE